MAELKPCPFCGSEAKLFVSNGVRVMCPKCRATSTILVDDYNGFEIRSNAVKSVIEAWNRRSDHLCDVMRKMDFISREAAIEALCADCRGDKCKIRDICTGIKKFRSIPAADVRPVIYGELEYVSSMTVRCSNCREIFHELEGDNFCTNCGADMREVKSGEK